MDQNPFKNPQMIQQEQGKLVGAYLPLPLADRLRLLSVYFGKSLQAILQEIIGQWITSVDKSEKEIIDALVERAVMEWQRRVIESGEMDRQKQDNYLKEIRAALQRRKVAERHIDSVAGKLKRKVGGIE